MNQEMHTALRIIDANLNRAREGLRVCEEVLRFYLEDKTLIKEFKTQRHKISDFFKTLDIKIDDILACRDSSKDAGKDTDMAKETKTSQFRDIFAANIQRTKEALRVLEEFTKSFKLGPKDYFKDIRFEIYELEKKTFKRIASSICNRR